MNSKKSIRGYDLDGVLAATNKPKRNKPYFKQNSKERERYREIEKEAYRKAEQLLKPKKPYHIITSRKPRYREVTEEWINKHKLEPRSLNLMDDGKTRENMIKFKRKKAKELNIDIFYEDDKKIAKALMGNGFKVRLVKHI